MTSVLSRPSRRGERIATRRHYLMCPPTHFAVTYAINPWMHPGVAVDVERALAQWHTLRRTYRDLGHRVDLLDPVPGLPDMVYAANGATVVDGQVYGARFRYAERGPEADAHRDWFRAAGYARVVEPEFVNEGEGDLLVAGGVILAGSGFRTDPRAHAEAARVLHREVVPLELVTRASTTSTRRWPCSTRPPSRGCRRRSRPRRARCWPNATRTPSSPAPPTPPCSASTP